MPKLPSRPYHQPTPCQSVLSHELYLDLWSLDPDLPPGVSSSSSGLEEDQVRLPGREGAELLRRERCRGERAEGDAVGE